MYSVTLQRNVVHLRKGEVQVSILRKTSLHSLEEGYNIQENFSFSLYTGFVFKPVHYWEKEK